MSEQVQEQVQEQAPKKTSNKAPKAEAPKVETGNGRVEKVEHQSGNFTIQHL